MDLGFCDSFGGLTRELSDLGFRHCAFVYMSLVVGGMYWRCSGVLLRTCHLLWVACTRDLMACSCINVTRFGWHVLKT